MKTKTLNLESLKKDLRTFGLNPKDWQLQLNHAPKKPSLLLHHKENHGFMFQAALCQQLKRIQEIHLLSI